MPSNALSGSPRRRFLASIGAVGTGAGLLLRQPVKPVAAQSEGNGDSWPQFGFDPANTGYNPAASAPSAPIEQQWVFETGESVESSPVVVDGTVFVGSGDDNLYALDAITGKQRWAFETQAGVSASPVVADGTVFAGSHDGNVYAVDAASGEPRWTFQTGERVEFSPVVSNGKVFVGSADNILYAIGVIDGEERWAFETEYKMISSPAVADGTVFAGNFGGRLFAVDEESGDQRWVVNEESDPRGVPFQTISAPTISAGTVFYLHSADNTLYALDKNSGDGIWSFQIESGATSRYVSSPAVTDGTVYVGSSNNNVYAVDAETGEQRWVYETGWDIGSSPSVVDGTVLIGSDDGKLYAIDRSSGELEWTFETGEDVLSSPAVADGVVYFGSQDNYVYAITTSGRFTQTITQESSNTMVPESPGQKAEGADLQNTPNKYGQGDISFTDSPQTPSKYIDSISPVAGIGAGLLLGGGLTYGAIRIQREGPTEQEAADGTEDDLREFVSQAGGQVTTVPQEGQPPDQMPMAPDVYLASDASEHL